MALRTKDSQREVTPAQARWRMLREALLSSSRAYQQQVTSTFSVRRFASFGLFDVHEPHQSGARGGLEMVTPEGQSGLKGAEKEERSSVGFHWLCYRCNLPGLGVSAQVAISTDTSPSLKDLVGFNNTGNVCLWPSEEVMAFFCLENLQLFTGATVCELGAGMAGLAGLFLACTHKPSEVVLTDGNSKSVDNLRRILSRNRASFDATVVSADVLLWDAEALSSGCHSNYCARFDHVLCADCLFFEEFHIPLALVVRKLLRAGGVCHMFAPERGKSVQLFCTRVKEWFHVELVEKYSKVIWEKHQECIQQLQPRGMYEPDIHYPMYLKLVPK